MFFVLINKKMCKKTLNKCPSSDISICADSTSNWKSMCPKTTPALYNSLVAENALCPADRNYYRPCITFKSVDPKVQQSFNQCSLDIISMSFVNQHTLIESYPWNDIFGIYTNILRKADPLNPNDHPCLYEPPLNGQQSVFSFILDRSWNPIVQKLPMFSPNFLPLDNNWGVNNYYLFRVVFGDFGTEMERLSCMSFVVNFKKPFVYVYEAKIGMPNPGLSTTPKTTSASINTIQNDVNRYAKVSAYDVGWGVSVDIYL